MKKFYYFHFIFILGALVLSSLSLYQHWQLKYSGGVARGFCDAKGVVGCDLISVSPWAQPVLGLPIAGIAVGLFLLLGVLGLIPRCRDQTLPLYVLMGMGSIFYLFQMIFVSKQLCLLCLATHLCIWLIITLGWLFQKIHKVFLFNYKIWILGIVVPLTVASVIQATVLPYVQNKNHWLAGHLRDDEFKLSQAPILPADSPKITLGEGRKKISMIVATDLMCLHCRDHFFELSRALKANRLSAEVSILMVPLDDSCSPIGGSLHPGACHAARIGLCQLENKKFDAFFKSIYLIPGKAMGGPETLLYTETSSPKEMEQLKTCADSKKIQDMLDQHVRLAYAKQISGTPVTWISGYEIDGAASWQDWEKIFRRIGQ